jgi:hypothetical protein
VAVSVSRALLQKAAGNLTSGAFPVIESLISDMRIHETADQNHFPIVPPGAGKKHFALVLIARTLALHNRKTVEFILVGGWGKHIAVSGVGNKHTMVKIGIGTSEDEIDIAGNFGISDDHPVLDRPNQLIFP